MAVYKVMKRNKHTVKGNKDSLSKNTVHSPSSSENLKVIWIFDRIDRDGKFAFDLNRPDLEHKGFLDKIISYSAMTWGQIRMQTHDRGKSKHHRLTEVDRFSLEARERIKKLALDEDTYRIFSFAFGNMLRIIGIREQEKFCVIWYDTNHEFYPTSQK